MFIAQQTPTSRSLVPEPVTAHAPLQERILVGCPGGGSFAGSSSTQPPSGIASSGGAIFHGTGPSQSSGSATVVTESGVRQVTRVPHRTARSLSGQQVIQSTWRGPPRQYGQPPGAALSQGSPSPGASFVASAPPRRNQVPVNVEVMAANAAAAAMSVGPVATRTSQTAVPAWMAQQAAGPISGISSAQGQPRPYVPPPLPNRVPTVENVEHLDPFVVRELLASKRCALIDVRGEDRASGLIDGAVHEPAIDKISFSEKVPDLMNRFGDQEAVVFFCQYSAHRAPQCANWYRQKAAASQRVAILSGGFRGWESMGLPVKALASGEAAQVADEIAMHLGTRFARTLPQPVHMPSRYPSGCTTNGATTTSVVVQGRSFVPMPVAPAAQQQQPQMILTQQPQLQLQQQPQLVYSAAEALCLEIQKQQQQLQEQARVYVPPHCPNRVPTVENVDHLEPETVNRLLNRGNCVLVDVRGQDRAAGVIEGSVHVPAIHESRVTFASRVPELVKQWHDKEVVIFMCQYSAHRAPQCANWYRAKASPKQKVAILSGGFRGWESWGLPVKGLADDDAALEYDQLALKIGNTFATKVLQSKKGASLGSSTGASRTSMTDRTRDTRLSSKPKLSTASSHSKAPGSASKKPPQKKKYVPPDCPNRVATLDSVEHLEPEVVHKMLRENTGILVDLRGEDRASGVIEGALHVPAIDKVASFPVKIPELVRVWKDHPLVVFTCQYSAHRAPQCANWYREKADPKQRVAILSGGFRGWEAEGLPVKSLAQAKEAKVADDVAMRLGNSFLQKFQEAMAVQTAADMTAGIKVAAHPVADLAPQAPPVAAAPAPVAATSRPVTTTQAPPIVSGIIATSSDDMPNRVPLAEAVEVLEPEDVLALLNKEACLLVDVRGEDRATGLIENSVHVPAIDSKPFAARVPDLVRQWADQPLVIFTCQYCAHRAPQCANWYKEKAPSWQRVAILKGGFRGWEAKGLPVKDPLSGAARSQGDSLAYQLGVQFVQQAKVQQAKSSMVTTPNGTTASTAPSMGIAARAAAAVTPPGSSTAAPRTAVTPLVQRIPTTPPLTSASPAGTVTVVSGAAEGAPQAPPPHIGATTSPAASQGAGVTAAYTMPMTMNITAAPPAPAQGMPVSDKLNAENVDPSRAQVKPQSKDLAVESIDPVDVYSMMQAKQCLLIDVRGEDQAAGLIDGAVHEPAIDPASPFPVRVPELVHRWANEQCVVFTCQYSRHRAPQCAGWYREQADPKQRVAILSGGFRGWEAKGLPVEMPASPEDAPAINELALRLGQNFTAGKC